MNTFLNDRLLYSFPIAWRSLLKQIDLSSLNYTNGETLTISTCIHLPSIYDIGKFSSSYSKYSIEADPCWSTQYEPQKVRFYQYFNMANPDKGEVHTSSGDPRDEGKIVKPGHIWNSYIYASLEDIDRYELTIKDSRTAMQNDKFESGGWYMVPSHILTRSFRSDGYLYTIFPVCTLSGIAQDQSAPIIPCFSI